MFFFFQAEDGIRDKLVTGVQTCALPICLTVAATDGNRARQLLLDYYAGALQLDSSNVQDFK